MYRSSLSNRDRAGTFLLVVLVHVALAYVFLNMSGTLRVIEREVIPQLIDIELEAPIPPIVEVPLEEDAAPEEEGAASAENIRSTATPVVAPKPRIVLPVPPPIPVTETPNTGSDPTQGAADRPGPGTGAGGVGTGTGSGGSGSGTGGGGSGGIARGPQVERSLTGRDYPDAVWRRWPRGGQVFVAVRVHPDGRATNCRVDRSSGDPMIDAWTCRLVETTARFRPAVNDRGEPVTSWYGYIQRDTGRFDRR